MVLLWAIDPDDRHCILFCLQLQSFRECVHQQFTSQVRASTVHFTSPCINSSLYKSVHQQFTSQAHASTAHFTSPCINSSLHKSVHQQFTSQVRASTVHFTSPCINSSLHKFMHQQFTSQVRVFPMFWQLQISSTDVNMWCVEDLGNTLYLVILS